MLIVSVDMARFAFERARNEQKPVIFPTDTIYGIGAPLSAISANEAIFDIKKRPHGKPFPILAGSIEQASRIADVDNIVLEAREYLKNWPGAYTFIFKSKKDAAGIYTQNGTIAVRIPGCLWLRNALIKLGEPVTATSVNISKDMPLNDIKSILERFSDSVSIFINGIANSTSASHIFDLSGDRVIKIR